MSSIYLDDLDSYSFENITEAWIELDNELRVDYVPTEVEYWRKAARDLRNELYDANATLEHGDVPCAKSFVAKEFHERINIFGQNPIDVLNEFLADQNYANVENRRLAA